MSDPRIVGQASTRDAPPPTSQGMCQVCSAGRTVVFRGLIGLAPSRPTFWAAISPLFYAAEKAWLCRSRAALTVDVRKK